MNALSIKQPWAAAIVLGLKDIENRGWAPSARGRFLVHASREPDFGAQYVEDVINDELRDGRLMSDQVRAALTCGAIVGAVTVTDCVKDSASRWAVDGQLHWVLSDADWIAHPVRCGGHLGFWPVPEHLHEAAVSQLRVRR